MKPTDIGKAYDQLTHLWEHNDFNLNNGVEQHKRAITFVKNREKALDIGCGCTCRFINLLKNEGFTVSGIDVSSNMLQIARRKCPDVNFIQADICEYALTEKYDFITAWDSIWHIPLNEQRCVLAKIIKSLTTGGIFIFSFGGLSKAGANTDSFMGPKLYYSSLGVNGFLQFFLDMNCIIRHVEFDQHPELHAYLIVEKT